MQVKLSLSILGLLVPQIKRVGPKRCRNVAVGSLCAAQRTGAHSGAESPLKRLLHLSFMSGSVAVILVGPCCPAPLPPKYIPAASRAGGEERTDWLRSGGEAGSSLRILPSRTDMKS